ncbi:MAG: diguanylate cyclase [Chloroflexales bacterium]
MAQHDLFYRLATATSLEEALPICLDIALRSQMDCGGIYLSDPTSGDLHLAYTRGLSPAFIEETRFVPAQSDRARMVQAGQPLYLDYDQRSLPTQIEEPERMRMGAVLPLTYQGRVVGCFNLASHHYTVAEVLPVARMFLEGIAAQAGHVIVRLQTEAALRESEMRFRTIFFEDRAAKLLIDPQTGRIMDANQSASDLYGYPHDLLTQMHIQEINQLTPEEVSDEMKEAVKHDKNFFAFRHRLASGEVRDVNVYSNTIEIAHQTYLLSFIHDVTEGTQAIAALRESEAKAQHQVYALEMLSTIITDISSTLDSERLAIMIVEHAKNLLGADAAKLITYDAVRGDVMSIIRTPALPPGYREDPGTGALRHVARTRQSFILNDYAAWPGALRTEIALGLVATLNVPLLYGDRLVGVLGVGAMRAGRIFTPDDQRLLTLFAQQAAVAIINAHLTARLQIDPLTGVHMRGRFFALGKDVMSNTAANGQPVGVAIFDLDHFKQVNDTYGHSVGDEVLRWVATQCSILLPPGAVFGRIGGEEFAVILPGADEPRTVAALEVVRHHVARMPIPTRQGDVMVTISTGVVALDAHREVTLDQVLEYADQALYQAKRDGRNRICTASCFRDTDPQREYSSGLRVGERPTDSTR